MRWRAKLPYIQDVLRDYPDLIKKQKETLTESEVRRIDAVNRALDKIRKLNLGEEKVQAIQLLYFSKTYLPQGVARIMGVGKRTVERWNAEAMRILDKEMNLM